MGKILKAVCSVCGFEKDIFEGGGVKDSDLENILDELSEKGKKILSEAVQLGAVQISINRKPCSCTWCRNIYAVPIVSYVLNGITHSISGQCPKCNEEKYTSASCCPECGNTIAIDEAGLWD